MSDPQQAPLGAPKGAEQVQEGSLLDQIVSEGRLARGAETTDKGKNLVRDFVQQVLQGAMTVSKDAEAMITARGAEPGTRAFSTAFLKSRLRRMLPSCPPRSRRC